MNNFFRRFIVYYYTIVIKWRGCDRNCLVCQTFFFYIIGKNDYFLVLFMLFVISIDDNSFEFFTHFFLLNSIFNNRIEPLKIYF
jgi:hypothetical protein